MTVPGAGAYSAFIPRLIAFGVGLSRFAPHVPATDLPAPLFAYSLPRATPCPLPPGHA